MKGNSLVDLSYDNNDSMVTCLTSGVPATSVYGECINNECPHLQLEITVDPVTLVYHNTLSLMRQTNSSYFTCITRRAERTAFATFLTKFGRGKHNNLHATMYGFDIPFFCIIT